MAYTIEVYDSGAGSWNEINWVRWKHERGDTFFSTLMFWCAYDEQDKLTTRAWVRMYDSSNVVWFRGKLLDEGEYRRSGEMKVTCRGRGQELLDYELDLDYTSSTVTNEDIVEDVFVTELGYTDSTNFNRENVGYSLTNYSFSGKLRDFLREMNRNYAYATVIEPDTSKYSDPSNAVPQVWYVPIGYYSSGESLDTSSDAVIIRKWRKGLDWNRKDKIRAFGIDANGDEIEAISGSISAFEDVFDSIYIPYAASSSELQDIADRIKDPGSKEGGIIEVSPKYEVYLANDTITLKDSPRSIDDTFVVKKQVNYSAGNKSELTLGEAYVNPSELSRQFEQEHMQNRHRLIKPETDDFGGQGTTNVDAASHDHTDGGTLDANNHGHTEGTFGAVSHPHGPGNYSTGATTGGSAVDSLGDGVQDHGWSDSSELTFPTSFTSYETYSGPNLDCDIFVLHTQFLNKDSSSTVSFNVRVDIGNGYYWPDSNGVRVRVYPESSNSCTIHVPIGAFHASSASFDIEVKCSNTIEAGVWFDHYWRETHVHNLPSLDVANDSGDAAPAVDGKSQDSSPSVSGNTADTQPGVSGSTDSKNVDVVKGDTKKDR